MKQDNFQFNSSEIPILADRILDSYKRDKLYFEQYSPKFNQEFLVHLEEYVNCLIHRTSAETLQELFTHLNERIDELLASFNPLFSVIEMFLRRNCTLIGLRIADFNLNDVKEALSNRRIWVIQRNCLKLISHLENNLNDFIDKGFVLLMISNFRLLIKKLNELEDELAEMTHQQGMIADEHHYVDHQLMDLFMAILESTPVVFGNNDLAKLEEYSLEKLMMQAQFNRSDPQ